MLALPRGNIVKWHTVTIKGADTMQKLLAVHLLPAVLAWHRTILALDTNSGSKLMELPLQHQATLDTISDLDMVPNSH